MRFSLVAAGKERERGATPAGCHNPQAADFYKRHAVCNVALKRGVLLPTEALIRAGRHGRWHVVIATQNPLDLKRSLLGIIPTFVSFQLHGEAAAAEILDVEPWVVESLGVGQWLAKVRTRDATQPRRFT